MASSSNSSASTGSGSNSWFPIGPSNSDGWRFDVITLLAVIGESSVAEHSQSITASLLCLLPRIIPAPQAMLRASRPLRMPEVKAKMSGVYSGVVLDSVGFFANIIHPLDDMRAHAFRVLEIRHKNLNEAAGGVTAGGAPTGESAHFLRKSLSATSRTHAKLPGPPADNQVSKEKRPPTNGDTRVNTMATGLSATFEPDPERAVAPGARGFRRRLSMKEKMTDMLANPTLHNNKERPAVPPNFWSPVHILGVLSTLLSVGLIIGAGFSADGTAIVAIAIISLASSVIGYASWWRPLLTIRSHTNRVPQGDVMIRTREGAFVLIRCTEDVARELYAGTEECAYYVGDRAYRGLMGLGTVMLMVAVVLLGNCNFEMQAAVGASYIVLNLLYWCMGLLPREFFWDLNRYEWDDVTPEDSKDADKSQNPSDVHRGVRSYTRTMWYAIRETKRTGWIRRSGAAANTEQWDRWLVEAEKEAKAGNREWNAVARKDAIMREWESAEADGASPRKVRLQPLDEYYDAGDSTVDGTVQHVPTDEVQLPATEPKAKSTW